MIVLLSPLHPSSALYSNTLRSLHSQQQAASALTMPCCVCLHSVISLLTVGMLSVFVSPFSFFHAQHYAEEVLCIPCQFQYVPLHTLALLSLSILHHYSSCSSSLLIHLPLWTGSGCFKLPSSDDSVAKDLLEECPSCLRPSPLVIWSSIQS